MLYDPKAHETSLATDLNGITDIVARFDTGHVIYTPYDPHNPLLLHRVVRFPSAVGDYGSTEKLRARLLAFIHAYVELPETFGHIAAHYVLLTWIYDTFNELPYLRVRGDFGTGKTRFLTVVGALCYKPIVASGASTVAPLFHMLNQVGGTLILDEADFRFSSETAEITKILNNGHAKGFPVMRCEMKQTKEFTPKAYTVFSPKIIATRNDYRDDALESRCISLDMGYKLTRTDIPHTLPKDFEDDATALRNDLLKWRFDHFYRLRDVAGAAKHLRDGRLNQIYAPLLSLVDDRQTKDKIIAFAQTQARQAKTDRGLKTEAELLTVIMYMRKEKRPLVINELATEFRRRYGTRYERKITPKWIGGVIRTKLRLATRKAHSRYMISENQHDRIHRLCERFDVEYDT